jgi:hypothetical protein
MAVTIGSGRPRLTGWLIFLIVCFFVAFNRATTDIQDMDKLCKPAYGAYPSLSLAVTIFQLMVAAAMIAWAYTAILVYRRDPRTLLTIKIWLISGAFLKLTAFLPVPLLAGLPPEAAASLLKHSLPKAVFTVLFAVVWYLYLDHSKAVREIYEQSSSTFIQELVAEMT